MGRNRTNKTTRWCRTQLCNTNIPIRRKIITSRLICLESFFFRVRQKKKKKKILCRACAFVSVSLEHFSRLYCFSCVECAREKIDENYYSSSLRRLLLCARFGCDWVGKRPKNETNRMKNEKTKKKKNKIRRSNRTEARSVQVKCGKLVGFRVDSIFNAFSMMFSFSSIVGSFTFTRSNDESIVAVSFVGKLKWNVIVDTQKRFVRRPKSQFFFRAFDLNLCPNYRPSMFKRCSCVRGGFLCHRKWAQ